MIPSGYSSTRQGEESYRHGDNGGVSQNVNIVNEKNAKVGNVKNDVLP